MARDRDIVAPHTKAREEEVWRLIREVIRMVRAGEPLADGHGMQVKVMHDLTANIDRLYLDAARLETVVRLIDNARADNREGMMPEVTFAMAHAGLAQVRAWLREMGI